MSDSIQQVFLSMVSSEFGLRRLRLAQQLGKSRRLRIEYQENLAPSGQPTLEMLDDAIHSSRIVVHVLGNMTGSSPTAVMLDGLLRRHENVVDALGLGDCKSRISYTQWEAYLAIFHTNYHPDRRPIALFICTPNGKRLRAPTYVEDAEQIQDQMEHRERLERLGYFANPKLKFSSTSDLASRLLVSESFNEILSGSDVRDSFQRGTTCDSGDQVMTELQGILLDCECGQPERLKHLGSLLPPGMRRLVPAGLGTNPKVVGEFIRVCAGNHGKLISLLEALLRLERKDGCVARIIRMLEDIRRRRGAA